MSLSTLSASIVINAAASVAASPAMRPRVCIASENGWVEVPLPGTPMWHVVHGGTYESVRFVCSAPGNPGVAPATQGSARVRTAIELDSNARGDRMALLTGRGEVEAR